MTKTVTQQPRIAHLADRLAADIEERNLLPGDRYLTTIEASKMLGVGNSAANRALQVLEKRRRIVRQQRKGAFVVDPSHAAAGGDSKIERIYLVMPRRHHPEGSLAQDELVLGLEHELPGVRVQMSFFPDHREEILVQELLNESLRAKRLDGFILVLASYESQRLLAEQSGAVHLPAVVYGGLYPSIGQLSSLAKDNRHIGELFTALLLERGHERIVSFQRQDVFSGEHLLNDGIFSTLQSAGRNFDALTLRYLPHSFNVFVTEAEVLLSGEKPSTGFICRTRLMAEAVAEAAQRKGLAVGKDIDVLVCDYSPKPGEEVTFTRAKSVLSDEELGRRLGQLLLRQVQNDADSVRHDVVPMKLDGPPLEPRGQLRREKTNGE